MRDNIDLTSNRMFRDSVHLNINLRQHREFPWSLEHVFIPTQEYSDTDVSIIPLRKQSIILGNKRQRAYHNMLIEMDSQNYCDCCGGTLIAIPWNRTYGLCGRCNANMEQQYGSQREGIYPWSRAWNDWFII